MAVEVVEVSDDDRNRKCNGENAGDYAERSDQLAPDADRRDVAVADRRHGDDRPPERTRDRRELTVPFAGLGVVGRRAEDHHRDQQEEKEHAQLVQTRLDGHAEDPQPLPQHIRIGPFLPSYPVINYFFVVSSMFFRCKCRALD